MANFARVKALGWSMFEKLTAAQMNSLDIDHAKAINGDDGGTWNGAINLSNLTLTSTNRLKYASRTISRVGVNHFAGYSTGWIINAPHNYWSQSSQSSFLELSLPLPDGVTLRNVQMRILPAGSHAGLPQFMPKFDVDKVVVSSGSFTQIGSTQTDASGTVGAYELIHSVPASPLNLGEVIDRTTTRYHVDVTGEGGTNWLTGLRLYGLIVSVDMTNQDEWNHC